MVLAMFVRGTNLPQPRRARRAAAALRSARERLWQPALLGTAGAVARLIVFPYDFRQALILSLLATIMCLSVVVITGFVGQISVVQLALAGVSGFIISHLATDHGVGFPEGMLIGACGATVFGVLIGFSALRVRGVSLAVDDPGRGGRDRAVRLPQREVGRRNCLSPVPEPKLVASISGRPGPSAGSTERSRAPCSASSSLGVGRPDRALCREPAPLEPRPADARGPLERAGRRRGRDQRPQRQAGRVRDQLVHRRNQRRALRLQLQLGHGRPVLRADRSQPDRPRVCRRDHDGLGRGGSPA